MKLLKKLSAMIAAVLLLVLALPVQAQEENLDPSAPVKIWNVVQNGDHYLISVKIRHNNEWDYDGINGKVWTISYPDAQGNEENSSFQFPYGGEAIKNGTYGDIAGAVVTQSEDEKDTLTITASVPASFFAASHFIVSFNGSTEEIGTAAEPSPSASAEVSAEPEQTETPIPEQTEGPEATAEPSTEPVPSETPVPTETPEAVIESSDKPSETAVPSASSEASVDGRFRDWSNESMTVLPEANGANNVKAASMVIENGKLYIYVQGDGNGSETNAGSHSNGKYAVTTDKGRTLLLQLNRDGTVSGGTPGMETAHSGSQWEISIPLSELPDYDYNISFGLYEEEPGITVTDSSHKPKESGPIVIDGSYGDWDNYPHTLIEYATSGTHADVPDAEAAIYYNVGSQKIMGHAVTKMPSHLNARGGDMTTGITVSLNEAAWSSEALSVTPVTADANGNLNWSPLTDNLPDGVYEYYLFDASAWRTAKNLADLDNNNTCYGKAYVSVQNGQEDIEWEVDADKLAAKYNISPSEIKTVNAQYGRLGQQWVSQGGASTGTVGTTGIALLSMAAVPFWYQKKRKNLLKEKNS